MRKVTFPPREVGTAEANAPASPPSSEQVEPRTSKRFKTRRPAFADPGSGEAARREERGHRGARRELFLSWFKLLVGFGPTLLLIAAFVWLSRRAAAASVADCSASDAAAPSALVRSSRRSPSKTSPGSTKPRTS